MGNSLKQHVDTLLDYMMNSQAPGNNNKYPFICAEMLQLDNDQVLSWFFPPQSQQESGAEKEKEYFYYEEKQEEEEFLMEETPPNQQEDKSFNRCEMVSLSSSDNENEQVTSLDGDQLEVQPKQQETVLHPVEIVPTCSLLDKLFLYLSEDFEHFNITSAGYFCKVVMNLLRQKEQESLSYIFSHPSVVDGLIINIHF